HAIIVFAGDNGRGRKIFGDFGREIWSRQHRDKIGWENLMQNLRHSHPAAMFYSFCATQKHCTSRTNCFSQMRCDAAEGSRWGRKHDQVSAGAITQFTSDVYWSGKLEPRKIICVFPGLLHV